MKSIRLFAMTVLCAVFAISCDKDPDGPGETVLGKITQTLDYPAAGKTKVLQFDCNTDWRLECDAEWLMFPAKLGRGKGILEVSCLSYEDSAPRDGIITVTAGKSEIKIPVTQSGQVIFEFVGTSLTASPTGDVLDIPIRSNIDDYVVSGSKPWITPVMEGVPEGFVRVKIDPNVTVEVRDGFVYATRTSDQTQISIKVEQAFATVSRATDSLALVKFFESAGGASWTNPWPVGDNTTPINAWNGVVTEVIDGQLRVTELRLWEQNISGPIPAEIDYLSELTLFHAGGGNSITGPLPQSITKLTKLNQLSLFRNNIEGTLPAGLGDMPALTLLHLDGNRLTGDIPSSLLLNAQWLSWSGILKQQDDYGFTNAVQAGERTVLLKLRAATDGDNWQRKWDITKDESEWGGIMLHTTDDGIRRVLEINLWDNNMTGQLPDEMGSLSIVRQIHMGGNNLTGPLPASMANLSELIMLAFPNNQMSGEISENFGDIETLASFWINDNNFSGAVPQKLLDHPKWGSWDFARNNFTNIGNQKP